ncbi:hypothetical protein [Microcoleus sp. herbarium14]|uniref:hypothetical protein n=1 Tax=Microcoleus sp. herbarium14 TaxID=3055439 RepID=UPI002FD473F6
MVEGLVDRDFTKVRASASRVLGKASIAGEEFFFEGHRVCRGACLGVYPMGDCLVCRGRSPFYFRRLAIGIAVLHAPVCNYRTLR